jgi:transcriptional regulator NrdR family protein
VTRKLAVWPCALEKEEAQMDVVVKKKKKKNEYTNENLLKDVRLSEPSDFQNFLRLDAT